VTEMHVYVGTYTSNGGEGVYLFGLNPGTGELQPLRITAGVVNPSYLVIHPSGRFLYTVNEVESYYGKSEGALSAFAIEPRSGELLYLNQQPSRGAAPCHLSLDQTGRFLFVANYGGSLAAFPLQADGSLAACSGYARHEGTGPMRARQDGPHVHCVVPDPGNRHVLAVDLGIDRIQAYALDAEQGSLRVAAAPTQAKSGSGPRQLAFHPNGKWAYVVHELQPHISRYAYDAMTGGLSECASLSCLPPEYSGENFASSILVDPRGRFLYLSNRGQDGIAHFRIDAEDGTLAFAGSEPTRGKFPRHFELAPGGRYLVAANQRSDSLTVFAIDADTGRLEFTGHGASVPSPVCVRIHAPPR
jgi:6-phosphogluconolactonase